MHEKSFTIFWMKLPRRMNRCSSLACDQMRFLWGRKTGTPFRKPCISFRCPACVSLSRKACKHPLVNARKSQASSRPPMWSCRTSKLPTGRWPLTTGARRKRSIGPRASSLTLPSQNPMLRGEVWWVDFDPSLGGEIQKVRPAVTVLHVLQQRQSPCLQSPNSDGD